MKEGHHTKPKLFLVVYLFTRDGIEQQAYLVFDFKQKAVRLSLIHI